MFKKATQIVVILIVMVMSASMFSVSALDFDECPPGKRVDCNYSLDSLDILLAAYRFMAAMDENELNTWQQIKGVKDYQPLYDGHNNVIAHYVSFEPSGYVIVNNTIDNPIVLEFSYSSKKYEDFFASLPEGQQCEFRMLPFGEEVKVDASHEVADFFESFISALSQKNSYEARDHQSVRDEVFVSVKGDPNKMESLRVVLESPVSTTTLRGSWGIIDWDDMPTGSYYARNLPGLHQIQWGRTRDFSATDHCGSVAAFNVVNYYSVRYATLYPHRPLLVHQSVGGRQNAFAALYGHIGPGPITPPTVSIGILTYVEDDIGGGHSYTGGPIGFGDVWNWATFRSRLNSRQMHIGVIGGGFLKLHYINIVGYREYSSGANYVRIVDNWNDCHNAFMHKDLIFHLWYTYVH